MGYVFSSTMQSLSVDSNNSQVVPVVEASIGHVTVRVHEPEKMYLGLEHSTTHRTSGYVIKGLSDAIRQVLASAITEGEMVGRASEKI